MWQKCKPTQTASACRRVGMIGMHLDVELRVRMKQTVLGSEAGRDEQTPLLCHCVGSKNEINVYNPQARRMNKLYYFPIVIALVLRMKQTSAATRRDG